MRIHRLMAIVLFVALAAASISARAGEYYVLDPAHTAVTFKISHLGLSWTHGRFNSVSGGLVLDGGKASFVLDIKPESVDTGNAKRDEHLRSPDFFNVKQFPKISFKGDAVKAVKDGYEVKGDLTLHGTTKPVTFLLGGGRKAEFPKGKQRIGYSTELTIKRSEFGMDKMAEMIGDEVRIAISFEATKD
jgi:polyisoprenoid-binding protein YceI